MSGSGSIDTAPSGRFADSRWTRAGNAARGDRRDAQCALHGLCLQYWFPVYAYLRQCGHAPAIAGDMAGAFFRELLASGLPLAPMPAQARFRGFLLESLHRFLAADWRQLEPPGGPSDPLHGPDSGELEVRYLRVAAAQSSAHAAFQRGYALELITRAHRRLAQEAHDAGRGRMYEVLAPLLGTTPPDGMLEALAPPLATRTSTLSIALDRLCQRFQELVRDELAQTVSDQASLERERTELLAALR